MYKLITAVTLITAAHFSSAQYYTGYYLSDPQVHSFDHFKIKQVKDDSKLQGNLTIHAYDGKLELWNQTAYFVKEDNIRSNMIKAYQHNEEIVSVHVLKFMWDGNEWEYIMLGYLGKDSHRHFIVIEEVFNDASESRLLEFNRFDWVKAHHLAAAQKNKP